jgi:putative nucleotidyltransferase with HDIG domain
MVLPTRGQCFGLLEKYNVPAHIVRHSEAVERVAVFLAKKLNEAGVPVDEALVSRAALLHDIDKLETLEPGKAHLHGKISRQILESEGFPDVGKIAERHQLEWVLSKGGFDGWEEKIVLYADKRVNDGKIVSLGQRFDYLLQRYGVEKSAREKILECRPFVESLEKDIFSKINAGTELEGV